jgi:hypothetical protein
MPKKQSDDSFSEEETARRFEAALRGALSTLPKPLKDIPKKRAQTNRPRTKSRRKTGRSAKM